MEWLAVILCLTIFGIGFAEEGCWRTTYGRGVGKPISWCPSDEDKNGALCYPKCKDGYYGVGPICWQKCPEGFKDIGVGCQKPKPYGRGAGYITKHKCLKKHSDTGCQKWGLLWYPKCKNGFHNVACCICSPDCPNGLIDSGVTCTKRSYGRGAGKPLKCKPDQEEDAALCYKSCASNFHGVGPVCWHHCPTGLKSCGALCLPTVGDCVATILSVAEEIALAVAETAFDPEEAPLALGKAIANLGQEFSKYQICPKMS